MPRIIAHAHTLWSYDGTLTLARWREVAKQRNCDVVLFAEHEETGWTPDRYADYVQTCASESTEGISLIPGIEFNQDGYHVLCYGLRHWPARPSSAQELAAEVHRQGCLLCLAHPVRYRWSYPNALLRVVDAVEVWNSNWVCDGWFGPHPQTLLLAQDKIMLVGQDAHKLKHISPLYIVTASDCILADLGAGRYVFELGRQTWTPDQLRQRHVAGFIQAWRTRVVQSALKSYRWIRRKIKKNLARLRRPACTTHHSR